MEDGSSIENIDNEDLLRARDAAWTEWTDFEFGVYYPRWYKKRKGWINPWKDMPELMEAQNKRDGLFRNWLKLHHECVKRGLPSMPDSLWTRWHHINTPDGRRYVK